jgi:uncharacterized LabA/DUF88 family protein
MRVSIFIDGSNFYHMQRSDLGWRISPEKLLKMCRGFGDVVDATYYAPAVPDYASDGYQRLLVYLGYSLVTKPLKVTNANGLKGNLDVELALDMLVTAPFYDTAILISGDGDFLRPLQIIKSLGKQSKVISTSHCVAWELREFAGGHYHDFKDYRDQVCDTAWLPNREIDPVSSVESKGRTEPLT